MNPGTVTRRSLKPRLIAALIEFRDEFLSEEDLDLQSLTDEELDAVWTAWLYQAQATNDED